MGNGVSARQIRGERDEIMKVMMPVFYVDQCDLTLEEIQIIRVTWAYIIDGTAPGYVEQKNTIPNFPHHNSEEWFVTTMLDRLFDVNPNARSFFGDRVQQIGALMLRFFTMIISKLHEEKHVKHMLEDLGMRHTHLKVRSVEFGIFGDIFTHTVRSSLGPEFGHEVIDKLWCKFFSFILKNVVPICLDAEMNNDHFVRTIPRSFFFETDKTNYHELLEKEITGVEREPAIRTFIDTHPIGSTRSAGGGGGQSHSQHQSSHHSSHHVSHHSSHH